MSKEDADDEVRQHGFNPSHNSEIREISPSDLAAYLGFQFARPLGLV